MTRLAISALATALAIACNAPPEAAQPVLFGGARPAELLTPIGISADQPAPLVVALHAFSSNGETMIIDTLLDELTAAGMAVIAPDGVEDSAGRRFWNGTDACCDFEGSGVDDVGYLVGLVDEISRSRAIDGVYLIGLDAGGFLAYGAGCRAASSFRGIVILGGATELVPSSCTPSVSVRVLHIHGDDDSVVTYGGNDEHPGATGSVSRWSSYNRCAPLPATTGARFDLDGDVVGSETTAQGYTNCSVRGDVSLWTMVGSGHRPALDSSFPKSIREWIGED